MKTDPQLVVQKTGLHEQCEADDHVTDNTYLECEPIYYSRYNEVVGLYLSGRHEYSRNHHEGEMEKALPKSNRKLQRAETESQWMNGAITK